MTDVVAVLRNSRAVAVPLTHVAPVGPKGDPGGNIMAIGLFVDAASLAIPAGTDLVRTSGHTAIGKGMADYFADPAVDAAYVAANPLSSFLDTNGRGFRLSLSQFISVTMFGALGDGVASDAPAIAAAIAFSKAHAFSGYGYVNGGPSLHFPSGVYNCGSTTISWDHALELYGDFGSGPAGGGTVLKWTSDVVGLKPLSTAGGSIIRNLFLDGAYDGTNESEAHGIWLGAKVTIRDVFIDGFAGDGINGGTLVGMGNVNGTKIQDVLVQHCRNGIYFYASDANALHIIGCQYIENRRYGLWINNTIGLSTIIGGEYDLNGSDPDRPVAVSYNGNRYYVLPDQEGSASTNAPSGDTTNTAYWAYLGPGGVDAAYFPAWSSGMTLRSGGAARFDGDSNFNTVVGGYVEIGFAPAVASGHSVFINFVTKQFDGLNNANIDNAGGPLRFMSQFGIEAASDPATNYFTADKNGVNTPAVYKVGGVQVVASPAMGVPANAADLPTAITLLNWLKDVLLSHHGLIGT